MANNVAIIGLGNMGGAMAVTFHRAGWKVTGYDPDQKARTLAYEHGVQELATAADAAGTDYVVLSLPNAALVRSTVPDLLDSPGTLGIVDTTTSDPATSRAMSELAQTSGTAFVDAPVSGGRTGALSGRLSAFVGATDESLETCRPALDVLTGGQFQHLGGRGREMS